MKTRHYKTFEGFAKQCGGQLNYNDFHKGQFYHKTAGWQTFTMPASEKRIGYVLLANAVYANGEKKAHRLSRYEGKAHGILDRLFFRRGLQSATYCAGQCYTSEIRTIQRIFREDYR